MEILKLLRKSRSETQECVASAIGVTQQAYANYEIGKREPDNAMLLKLARHFNTTVGVLLGESASDQNREIVTDALLSRLSLMFKYLPETDKVKIASYAELVFNAAYARLDLDKTLMDFQSGRITMEEMSRRYYKDQEDNRSEVFDRILDEMQAGE